ncbi:MAG: acyltransferase domain-containing protein, partial [Thermodesulfobacteriota bacterium]
RACILSLDRTFAEAGIPPGTISLFEAHGSGDPAEDDIESAAVCEFFSREAQTGAKQCALGSAMPTIGHTGAAAGLAAFAKAVLCVYQQMTAPLRNFMAPADGRFETTFFHMPKTPQFWLRNRVEGPRRACVGSMTADGGAAHAVIEEYEWPETTPPELLAKIERERRQPLGFYPGRAGLFVVEGDNNKALMNGLDRLHQYIRGIDGKNAGMEKAARGWYAAHGVNFAREYAVAIVAGTLAELDRFVEEAKGLITSDRPSSISGMRGIKYSTHLHPVGSQNGQVAFVFPGSGNHYLGMGREIGVDFPTVARQLDAEARKLKERFLPECFFPWRDSWKPGWEEESRGKIGADPLNMIIGQVSHGGLMAWLARRFGLKPDAVIGYSLGESAGLFATGAWKHRSEMLDRMRASDLFKTQLAGPCNAAREVWRVPPDEEVDWRVAVVNRSADQVKKAIRHFPLVYLLIVNTPTECVIGGRRIQVEEAIKSLGCEAVFLEGVVTVHCDAAVPVKEAYRALHQFPVTPPEGVRFYSCARGKAIELTSESAAQSITDQALYGFDFTETVLRAYRDGVRVFIEMGPHNSCTRMIQQILADRPHLAVSMCNRSENSYLTVLKCVGTLIAERVPVDLEFLYGAEAFPPVSAEKPPATESEGRRRMPVKTGRKLILPEPVRPAPLHLPAGKPQAPPAFAHSAPIQAPPPAMNVMPDMARTSWAGVMEKIVADADATTRAHQAFLEFSSYMNQVGAQTFALQAQLLEAALAAGDLSGLGALQKQLAMGAVSVDVPVPPQPPVPARTPVSAVRAAFDRDMCMEFAVGSVAKVLGPAFAVVDTYPVRVRLPDEPLMLVDRIVSVEGEKGSLGPGRVVTEHDVHPDAWYLQADRVPVCISIEAGQADLFLCSYLGIDLAVKGKRSYRLLDAVATFHEGLPRSGRTIRYEIEIKKFVRQGETYLFFFEFNGYIGSRHIITMRNGCAGFFTPEEVKASGGIVLKKEDLLPRPGKIAGWKPLVAVTAGSYTDDQIAALRKGDLEKCFGPLFAGMTLPPSLCLPGGRMRLIDRILSIDPAGGRYGLGNIKAQADIHPDDWFLTCHFVDDMVMPGTLMYQCCEQALRVLVLRMGWVTGRADVCFEPVPDQGAVLKCRGPVTRETRHVLYEIELREIGYNPEPYVLADAFMYADGDRIVMFERMSLKATGLTKDELETFWAGRGPGAKTRPAEKPTLYGRDRLLAYAVGKPSEAFGPPYKIFDEGRIIARLPGPPYFFMDRVTFIDHPQWEVRPGGWIEAEYTVRPGDWYFKANRQPSMPFCVLLEIALQPCGWLAAYAGSALRSPKDVKFRNLGGKAVQHVDLLNEEKTLTMRARMTKVSESGGMLIQHFNIEVLSDADEQMVYSGTTYFGFFSAEALARQVGVPKAAERCHKPSAGDLERADGFEFDVQAPLTPDDNHVDPAPAATLPGKALLMVDGVECWVPNGGSAGLGFIRGVKQVDPDEWFFRAHFYQDPVCPGSLGLESFLQLLKEVCRRRWPEKVETHRFEFVTGNAHEWIYRGQIIPKNRRVEVEADIIRVEEAPFPAVFADGFLKV